MEGSWTCRRFRQTIFTGYIPRIVADDRPYNGISNKVYDAYYS